ncbi:MAG: lasso RiPP family leader peptide-containing protein [Saccharopolyspora sp.]|nr:MULTISPECIES: lasso RiPP family leader peptide-containing protein [unclassified Saccharopolyspora]MBK0870691.1 lasso RiPP family leader peptide-containing protein [Saccharopolyspora sp. HNM0986]MBQ6641279.1 lasso RiPP family leader peptide-containing protein [Saccharopolyspora sp.]
MEEQAAPEPYEPPVLVEVGEFGADAAADGSGQFDASVR